jgi:hypothetical protein
MQQQLLQLVQEGVISSQEMQRILAGGAIPPEVQNRLTGGGGMMPAGPGYPPTGGTDSTVIQPYGPGTGYVEETVKKAKFMYIDDDIQQDELYSYKVKFVGYLAVPDLTEDERNVEGTFSEVTEFTKMEDDIEFHLAGGTPQFVSIEVWRWIFAQSAVLPESEVDRLKAEANLGIASDAVTGEREVSKIPTAAGHWEKETFQVKKGDAIGRSKTLYKKDALGNMGTYEVDFYTGCTLVDAKYGTYLVKDIVEENVYDEKGKIIGKLTVEKRRPTEKLQIVYLDRKGNLQKKWQGVPERERAPRAATPRRRPTGPSGRETPSRRTPTRGTPRERGPETGPIMPPSVTPPAYTPY